MLFSLVCLVCPPHGHIVYHIECGHDSRTTAVSTTAGVLAATQAGLSDILERTWNAPFHAESSKTSSKRKSSSSGTTEPKAKKPKQQRVALNEAATAMHAELRAMGFRMLADFGNVKWEDFKTQYPEVTIQNPSAHTCTAHVKSHLQPVSSYSSATDVRL